MLLFSIAALINTVVDTFLIASMAKIKNQKTRGIFLTVKQILPWLWLKILDEFARERVDEGKFISSYVPLTVIQFLQVAAGFMTLAAICFLIYYY